MRVAAAAGAAAALAGLGAGPVWAHGGATGTGEFLQHNLVTVVLAAILLGASGGLAWVTWRGRRTDPGADQTASPVPPEDPGA